jgi:hypothetical protein
MAEKVIDQTATPVGETNVDDVNGGKTPESPTGAEADTKPDGSSASKDTPFDQDPKWIAARAAQKSLDGLLADKGFDSIEDLTAALERGSGLEDKLSGKDLDAIIEGYDTLEEYKVHWAEQERLKRDENETPEDKIARLEREYKELQSSIDADKSEAQAVKDAAKAIDDFNSGITTLVAQQQDLPAEYHEFTNLMLGADNPMLDVDPADKKAFTGAASEMIDKVRAFEQAVITRYKAGKTAVPDTPPGSGSEAPAPAEERKPIKTIKEAAKIALERLTAANKT